jgi:hypothetical protein
VGRILRGNFAEQYDGTLFEDAQGRLRGYWWVQPSIWRERYFAENVDRRYANEAEARVYKQAKALSRYRRWRNVLTDLEDRAIKTEIRFIREHRQPAQLDANELRRLAEENPKLAAEKRQANSREWLAYYKDKWEWIAAHMGEKFTARQARDIIEAATNVMTDAEEMRDERIIEMIYERKQRQETEVVRQLHKLSPLQFRLLAQEVLSEQKRAS